jgi:glycosidase
VTADPSLFVFGHHADPEHIAQQARHDLAGLFHGWRMEPPAPGPDEPVTLTFTSAADSAVETAMLLYWFEYAPFAFTASDRRAIEMSPGSLRWDELAWRYVRDWTVSIPCYPEGTGVRYSAEYGLAGGETRLAETEPGAARTVFGYDVADKEQPDWIRDAVIYQILVDRFYDDRPDWGRPLSDPNEIYGGTLRGVATKLDYLADLGVNCLWLTPIVASETHHGYDALNFGVVDAKFGGEAALRDLVSAAHARRMRVLLDLAANHCSSHNPLFLDARQNPQSPYRCWFHFTEWPDTYDSFFDVPELPTLNTTNPEVLAYFKRIAHTYLHDIGADGFRLDYVVGPSLLFWTRFARAVHEANPEAFTVGEATVSPAELRKFSGRLDGCLDFSTLQAFRQFFIHGSIDAAGFDGFVTAHADYLGDALVLPTFLDNHDMNRFLWAAGGETRTLRVAALCQMSLPQPPIIYYGTEIGLSQEADVGAFGFEASRLPMRWDTDPDAELHAYYRALIHLRRDRASLRRGTRRRIHIHGSLLVYAMTLGSEITVIALNSGPESVCVPCTAFTGTDLFSGEPVDGPLVLEPYTGTMIDAKLLPQVTS